MSDKLDQLNSTLKRHQLSVTTTRHHVFRALQGKEPQTMHNIVAACRGSVDRASVYRTITLFEKIGVVQRLQIGWKYKLELSNNFHHHHHHFSCRLCGQIIPMPEDRQLESRLQKVAKQQGFKIEEHQLEIQGICQNCQQA